MMQLPEPYTENGLIPDELSDFKHVKAILENPGFSMKVARYIGKPIAFAIDKIDSESIRRATFEGA